VILQNRRRSSFDAFTRSHTESTFIRQRVQRRALRSTSRRSGVNRQARRGRPLPLAASRSCLFFVRAAWSRSPPMAVRHRIYLRCEPSEPLARNGEGMRRCRRWSARVEKTFRNTPARGISGGSTVASRPTTEGGGISKFALLEAHLTEMEEQLRDSTGNTTRRG
jgi:hypothetical protein